MILSQNKIISESILKIKSPCIVTGCAGFIGSNMVNFLLARGYNVIGIDNFSTGQRTFIANAIQHPNFKLIETDLLNVSALTNSFKDGKFVFHFAANADVRFGINNTKKDLEQNTLATYNVLEAMRNNTITDIAFSSTGSIYGETAVIPTPEHAPFPIQTSLYGASKLACEGLISAYCEAFNFKSWIFRFVSIVGTHYTHGHIFDFYKKLKDNPTSLYILGDGQQQKSYLHVDDCIKAIFIALQKSHEKVNIFNLGTDHFCKVNDSVKWICETLGVKPTLSYSGGNKGWVGDNPFIFLDTTKIQSLGWHPQKNIQQSIIQTVNFIKENEWLLETR